MRKAAHLHHDYPDYPSCHAFGRGRILDTVAVSTSLPIFLSTARELAARLAGDASPQALQLSREAEELAHVFEGWEKEPPEAHQRSQSVGAVLDLQRRVMDYLAAHAPHAGEHHG